MAPLTILLVLVCVALNTVAQLLLKAGVKVLGVIDFGFDRLWYTVWRMVFEWHIFVGLVCYVTSVIVWLSVLSRTEVSVAYPLSSLGYVATAVAAWYLFGEPMTGLRVGGILIIIFGVYLVARSS
jgi:drug/metabolite transporter (DMT)-like permease